MTTELRQDIDEGTFARLAGRHRRELHVHCYRMCGSFEEAEDLVQETFLRAWRRRETYAGRATLRAWLYRIATNACLDALDARRRHPPVVEPGGEVTWLQPYPDHLLEQLADEAPQPDAAVVAKETIELAYLVAIQHVPPRPRAVLILRDVLGWSAKETAELLETSVPAVNSALQRAHATMKEHLPRHRSEWGPGVDADAARRDLLARYIEASEQGDAQALAATLREDLRWSMPPQPGTWTTREGALAAWAEGGFGSETWGDMRCLVTAANRQPAIANYVRRPGDDAYRPMALDVVRIEDGLVADIVTFPPSAFEGLGLPETL